MIQMVIMMKDKFMKDDENNNEKVDEYNYDNDNDDYNDARHNYSGHINDNHDGVNDDVHNNGTGIKASQEDFFLRF